MITLISQAFLLGLSVGPACLGFCAPVCVPYIASEKLESWRGGSRVLALFLLGRLAGYTLVGAAVGFAGSSLLRTMTPAVSGAVRIATGLMLIAFGLLTHSPAMKWCPELPARGRSALFAAALGLLSGINLCPPFAAAIAGAAATASVLFSLVYFWAFFAGTAVCFVPLAFLGTASRVAEFRQVARICMFMVGIWMILEGALHLI